MNSLAKATEIYPNSVSEFQKACLWSNRSRNNFKKICELYKSFLDANFTGRFCTDGNCKTIFMVEIKYDGSKWGATPKTFYTQEEAEKEVEALKIKCPFIYGYRIVTRREKD